MARIFHICIRYRKKRMKTKMKVWLENLRFRSHSKSSPSQKISRIKLGCSLNQIQWRCHFNNKLINKCSMSGLIKTGTLSYRYLWTVIHSQDNKVKLNKIWVTIFLINSKLCKNVIWELMLKRYQWLRRSWISLNYLKNKNHNL